MNRIHLLAELDGVRTTHPANLGSEVVLLPKDARQPKESRQTLLAEPEYNKGPGLIWDRPIGF